MGSFSITHWLIFLGVIVLVFGTSKLKNVGKDIGSAVKDFKNAVTEETQEQVTNSHKVIEHDIDSDTVPKENTHNETNTDKI